MNKNLLLTALATSGVIGGVVGMPSQAQAFNLTGYSWGAGATVSYSFMSTGTSCPTDFYLPGVDTDCTASTAPITAVESLVSGFEQEVKKAFAAWSAIANINFVEVADSTASQIRIGAHEFDGTSGTLAHAFTFSSGPNAVFSELAFDITENWAVNSIDGNTSTIDIFQVAAHEIGHAIGLDHDDTFTALMNTFYSEAFSGPQLDDINGAISIYGAAVTSPTKVPEPGTIGGLLGLGLLGAIGTRRKALSKAGK